VCSSFSESPGKEWSIAACEVLERTGRRFVLPEFYEFNVIPAEISRMVRSVQDFLTAVRRTLGISHHQEAPIHLNYLALNETRAFRTKKNNHIGNLGPSAKTL
jgi:hypothetical protein